MLKLEGEGVVAVFLWADCDGCGCRVALQISGAKFGEGGTLGITVQDLLRGGERRLCKEESMYGYCCQADV